jgi:hypothetical protein
MTTLVSTHEGHRGELTPRTALRYAWYVWMVLLAIPFLVFLYVAWQVGDQRRPIDRAFTNGWFLGSVAYMLIAPTIAFFVRSRYFQGYWSGECVSPRNYLIGMCVLWGALVLGGVLSLIGCLGSRSLLPCMFPAMVAFAMFVIHWPSGRAMVCGTRGAADDPETYEEPR